MLALRSPVPAVHRRTALFVATTLALAMTVGAQAPVVRSPVQVDQPGSMPGSDLALAVDGDTVAALFFALDPVLGGRAAQLAVSHDAGVSFAAPVVLDDDASSVEDSLVASACAVVGDSIYAAWLDYRLPLHPGIQFTFSRDGGQTFLPPRRLSDAYPGTGTITAWDLAASPDPGGDDVHVLFASRAPTASVAELFALSSLDGGVTFGSPVLVYGDAGSGVDVGSVALAVEGNTLHAVWDDDSAPGRELVWYRRSDDGGASFSSARLSVYSSDVAGTRAARLLALAQQGLRVGVLFEARDAAGGGNAELRLALSTNGGQGFPTDQPVSGPPTAPRLALSADELVVADALAGTVQLYSSSDDGDSFQLRTLGTGSEPRIACNDSERFVVTWRTAGAVPILRASFSLDGGATWSAPLDLTDDLDGVESVQGPLALEPTRGNVVGLGGQVPPVTGTEELVAVGFSTEGGAEATFRNAGTNPTSLTSQLATLGRLWTATLDVGATGHAVAALVGALGGTNLPLPGGQVLLSDVIGPSGEVLGLAPKPGPVALFAVSVPNDPLLTGLDLTVQGVHLVGSPTFLLSNAYDLRIAAF